MNTDPSERLEHAAEEAADGVTTPIAGAAGEAGDVRETLENLRVLARLAQIHRAELERGETAPAAGIEPLFQWGPLLALDLLGSGSFGEVYRALDPALGRVVALKLRPARESGSGPAARRWLDEGRRLARIRHPNVVQVFGAAIHDERPGLWMELVAGETLERQLERRGPTSWREACTVGIELCAALSAVHQAGLVHQDVKASNVMREGGPGGAAAPSNSGRIVLMDFGAGQRLDSQQRGTGGAFGTPLSTAPEVLSGEPPTPRSDVYSLGALLYRLVTGRHPIDADHVADIVARARAGRVTPLHAARPDISLAFVTAVERALDPEASKRWASAAEFERVLAATLTSTAAIPTGAATNHRTVRGQPASRASLAIAATVLASATIWMIWAALHSFPGTGSVSVGAPGTGESGRAAAGSALPAAGTAAQGFVAARPAVEARLLRAVPDGAEEVHSGDMVAPGDQLALALATRERLWIYVLNEDHTGAVTVLFPVPGLVPANPMPAGQHRLPGGRKGRDLDWQVTSAGGQETFLFVASRASVPALEARLAATPAAREGAPVSYARLDDAKSDPSRGVAGLAPSQISQSGVKSGLDALARSLAARADSSIWIDRVVVANPGP